MSLLRYTHKIGGDPFSVAIFQTKTGEAPFEDWFLRLSDSKTKAIIRTRIARLRLGNFGDRKAVGDGVWEIRIDFGPGFRLYYALYRKEIILLLTGGDKASQRKDIKTAKAYWLEFRSEKNA